MRALIVLALLVYGASLVAVGVGGCLKSGKDGLRATSESNPHIVKPDSETSDSSTQPQLATPAHSVDDDEAWVGFNFNVYHPDDLAAYREGIDQVAGLGFGSVQFVVPMFQRDGGSIEVWTAGGPGFGPTREQLVELIRYAKGKGMRVSLMPQVNFMKPRGNEWRGKIQPPSWRVWWASYQAAMDQYVDIANETDVDQLVVGCELISTQGADHLERWRSLIEHIRGRYSGSLTYSTTWDSYHRVLFWDRLDRIGVSGYWDMTEGAADPGRPTDAELAARWSQIQRELRAFSELVGKPVLVTELGYPSLAWALEKPWNYVQSGGVKRDVEAQRRGYEAAVGAWRPVLDAEEDWLAGVMLYKWDIFGWGGERDTGYGVRGKPAYGVVEGWGR